MDTRSVTITTFLLTLVIIASGCSSSGGDSAPPLIPLDTSVIRSYQQGDSLSASYTLRDTSSGSTASGTITVTVGAIVQNPFGIDCRSVTYAGTVTGPGGSVAINTRSLFYQDSTNSVYECGHFDDDLGRYVFVTDTATSPNGVFLTTKSPMQVGDSNSGVIFYDDGSWEDCTRSVQGIENVSVPLGFYETYKEFASCSESDGSVMTYTQWVVPSIFNIKESGLIDGFSVEILVTSANMI